MPEPSKRPTPVADAERERKKSGLPLFFLRLKERIYGLFAKGDFKEGLRQTLHAPAAVSLRELPQWKPRGIITAGWLLGKLWRQKIPLAIAAGLFVWIAAKVIMTQDVANFHRWLPGSSAWEASSSSRGRIWDKHSAQTKPVPGGLAAAADSPASADNPVSHRFLRQTSMQDLASVLSRTLIGASLGGGPLSAAFLGDGTQTFASDGSPTFAGDDLIKNDKRWDAAVAAAVHTDVAPRLASRDNQRSQDPTKESSSPAGEQMAAAMSEDNADLEKKLADYAKNETWRLEKATTHEETLPPLEGDALKNSKALQQLWVTRKYNQFALYCGSDCRLEKRMHNNRATFYGDKN